MQKDKVIFTSGKESFVARMLIKKMQDGSIDAMFVPCNIDALDTALRDIKLLILYLDDDTRLTADIIHFITDRLREHSGSVILAGEKLHIDNALSLIPEGIIYNTFIRPINNDEFVSSVKEYFKLELNNELKKSILIVDDDPQYLNLVREWLKDTYKVNMASSGLQAIKMLGKTKVDLILLDFEMPVTNGPQVLEMLRADEDTKSIPVMFLTSKDDKKSVMEVVALRPEGYFLKSIEREELLLKLSDYFLENK